MLLGDYELSDLRDTMGITVLFVIFTNVGVIILLNVLIAIVSDSYERAMLNSSLIFGRARSLFIVQNEALESFLRPCDVDLARPAWSGSLFLVLRWIMLVAIILTAGRGAAYLCAMSLEVYGDEAKPSAHEIAVSVWFFCVFLVLMAGWCMLVGLSFESILEKFSKEDGLLIKLAGYPRRFNTAVVRWLARILLGLSCSQKRVVVPAPRDKWSGRINYIRTMVSEIVEESQNRTAAEISALETVSCLGQCGQMEIGVLLWFV